uniref:Ubiquitin carboxyl-terminal hydrolase n=1 Tax=Romanomermis culicivorax TaxID=13658 RepID=A0A915KFX2_ROMCU
PATSSAPTAQKSWASLFRNSPTANNAIVISKLEDEQMAMAVQNSLADDSAAVTKQQEQTNIPSTVSTAATINVSTSTSKLSDKPQFAVAVTTIERDPPVQKLIQVLKKQYRLEHKGPVYYARGLKNFGNYCYVNAVLQALLACPPFVHLLRNLSFLEMRTPSSTPMLDALVKFVGEFFGDRYGSGRKNADEKQTAFEPTYVYNVLSSLRSDLGYRGRQEDAEEFLSLVLNHLHEEMAACLNFNNPPDQANMQSQDVRFSNELSNNANNSDSSEWQQVMPGRKLATARTSKLAPTPIAQIFSGVVRNAFSQPGQKDSVNNESFFTLQLSVQDHENTSSSAPLTLQAAMKQMVHEVILRRDSSKKGDVDITRRTTFQELPFVLILHLKYFTYVDDTVKKHMKPVAYQMDLHIDRNLMPSSSNSNTKARSYKLFAVVFHHGENAEGGHYTADIFHGGQWLCMDDTKVEPVTDAHVLNFDPPRVPYLLFYRRCDVLSDNRMVSQQQQNAGNFIQRNRFSGAQE